MWFFFPKAAVMLTSVLFTPARGIMKIRNSPYRSGLGYKKHLKPWTSHSNIELISATTNLLIVIRAETREDGWSRILNHDHPAEATCHWSMVQLRICLETTSTIQPEGAAGGSWTLQMDQGTHCWTFFTNEYLHRSFWFIHPLPLQFSAWSPAALQRPASEISFLQSLFWAPEHRWR